MLTKTEREGLVRLLDVIDDVGCCGSGPCSGEHNSELKEAVYALDLPTLLAKLRAPDEPLRVGTSTSAHVEGCGAPGCERGFVTSPWTKGAYTACPSCRGASKEADGAGA